MHKRFLLLAAVCGLGAFALQPAMAANVKITPLGSHSTAPGIGP
jgi:hypothetical protein